MRDTYLIVVEAIVLDSHQSSEMGLNNHSISVLPFHKLITQQKIVVEQRSKGALAVVLHQLLPVCYHDFDHSHEAFRHLLTLVKVIEEVLHFLDADSSLLNF